MAFPLQDQKTIPEQSGSQVFSDKKSKRQLIQIMIFGERCGHAMTCDKLQISVQKCKQTGAEKYLGLRIVARNVASHDFML